MDPLTVVVSPLIAGAASGGKDAASATVRDAYTALFHRLTGGGTASTAVTVIEANEAAPNDNIGELEAGLGELARRDRGLHRAAHDLLSPLAAERVGLARHRIALRHARGVQIGDHNTLYNTYG
ncbi:RIP homotypic interaction motif-containing protein [Nocardia nova]|uniref:Uncharacterized protein n=1 Tax=Nocardia nova TaxID=37330 RepID=A0A2S6AAV9_9NOCA|nr:RIP homotypic interaction motif-containing protein [Nocardia nova]PPJ30646.1 hypothetical protein C5F51_09360 [Nocardia nova]